MTQKCEFIVRSGAKNGLPQLCSKPAGKVEMAGDLTSVGTALCKRHMKSVIRIGYRLVT